MRFVLMAVLVLVFSGCATEANYRRSLQSWVGHSEMDLVSRWGAPSSTYQAGDSKILTYNQSNGETARMVFGQIVTQNNGCSTTFTVNNIGIIERWAYQGNTCRE